MEHAATTGNVAELKRLREAHSAANGGTRDLSVEYLTHLLLLGCHNKEVVKYLTSQDAEVTPEIMNTIIEDEDDDYVVGIMDAFPDAIQTSMLDKVLDRERLATRIIANTDDIVHCLLVCLTNDRHDLVAKCLEYQVSLTDALNELISNMEDWAEFNNDDIIDSAIWLLENGANGDQVAQQLVERSESTILCAILPYLVDVDIEELVSIAEDEDIESMLLSFM